MGRDRRRCGCECKRHLDVVEVVGWISVKRRPRDMGSDHCDRGNLEARDSTCEYSESRTSWPHSRGRGRGRAVYGNTSGFPGGDGGRQGPFEKDTLGNPPWMRGRERSWSRTSSDGRRGAGGLESCCLMRRRLSRRAGSRNHQGRWVARRCDLPAYVSSREASGGISLFVCTSTQNGSSRDKD